MALHSPRNSQGQFMYNPATPPPPPPKPSGHSSGTATPLTGPPRPPLPPGQGQTSEQNRYSGAYQANQAQAQYIQHTAAPEPPPEGWLPNLLKDKPTPDLQALLANPSLQQALLHDPATAHASIAASAEPLKAVLAENLALATALKALEAQIQAQREATQSRLLSLRALEAQFRSKQTEQEAALKDFSAPALYQKLVGAISEQESLCRGLEESFLEDEGVATDREVEQFVKRLKEARKIAYLRRERKERWDEGRVGGWR